MFATKPPIVAVLGGWRAALFAVLAVAAVICFLVADARAARSGARADAAEQRAEALAGEVRALKDAQKRDAASDTATDAARAAADRRQPEREARAAKVKSYADAAGDPCRADPRIVRELADGEGRVRSASRGLRGDGRPEGGDPDPAAR